MYCVQYIITYVCENETARRLVICEKMDPTKISRYATLHILETNFGEGCHNAIKGNRMGIQLTHLL